jgi:hypothetical protein
MGILADFFVATPEHAMRYANSLQEPDDGEEIRGIVQPREFKGFTGIEFEALWAILAHEEWDPKKHSLEYINLGEENESWLQRFPDGLVALLARANQEQLTAAAADWAETEDVDFEAGDLEIVLGELHKLAVTVQRPETAMYLWGCL